MTTPDAGPAESRTRTASIVLLGTDAVLAARPATAVQLAHACLQAGFSTVIPPSWGDELLAAETMRQLQRRDTRPVVYCACPRVSERLLEVSDDLVPFLLPLVPPPVAAARYLREIAGRHALRITFVGHCPAGADASIDAHLTPAAFLAMLAERDIGLATQPVVFEAVLPPDRRRHRSLPGGVPTPEMLWSQHEGRALVEIEGMEPLTDLAQHLASGEDALLDLAPSLDCSCSGAGAGMSSRSGRGAITSLEPPRSTSDIVDVSVRVQLLRPLPVIEPARATVPESVRPTGEPDAVRAEDGADASAGQARRSRAVEADVSAESSATRQDMATSGQGIDVHADTAGAVADALQRRSSGRAARASGWLHTTARTSDGRPLPRAYLARRRAARSVIDQSATGERGEVRAATRVPHGQAAESPRSARENGSSQEGPSAGGRSTGPHGVSGRLFASVPIAGTRPAVLDPAQPATPLVEHSRDFDAPAMELENAGVEPADAPATTLVAAPASTAASDPSGSDRAVESAAGSGESVSEPASEPACESATQSAPESASEPASELTPESAPESGSTLTSESGPASPGEPEAEPGASSADEAPARQSSDPETILLTEVRGAVDEIVGLLGSALGTMAGLVRQTLDRERDRDDQTGSRP